MPCRGTGQVISNLGGSHSLVSCPWCAGSGVRAPGVDAQAHWREEQGEPSEPPADGGGEPAAAPDSAEEG